MKIAICDDEEDILNEMGRMVSSFGYKVDCFTSPKALLDKEYAMYFLDIGIEEMNGIETGKQLRKKYPQACIIYVTNFDDYRAQAFGVHAFDYLKKPIKREDVKRVFDDARDYLKKNEQPSLSFKTKEGMLQIKAKDILYFEFYGRNVLLHSFDTCYKLVQSMHIIAQEMKVYNFEMSHKSFCINLEHVKLVKGYDITMINGITLPLSQKRSNVFRKELNHYLCKRVAGNIL